MRRGLAAGALLRTDYAEFYAQRPDAMPTPPLRPFLIGLRREEASEGSTMAPTFFYSRPRFGLKPWEQDMLTQALLGKSDAELSTGLHVSPSTVAKRWHAIYERTAAVATDLFPCDAATGQSPQTRGSEKRRHLLAYLRHHPEELRPHLPPADQRG
jgi:DNA-binding CsgD family transcriptional regulator